MAKSNAENFAKTTLRPSELVQVLELTTKAGLVPYIWGPPGVGKSDIVAQLGEKYNRPVVDFRLLLCAPDDIKGIPYFSPETKRMEWAAPSELPFVGNDERLKNAILFLDELSSAPPMVQASAYQLVLNRRVGPHQLFEGVSMIAAGNRTSDNGVSFRMPTPLANRLVHFELEVSHEDWIVWAAKNDVHPSVIGFLSENKHLLDKFDPNSPEKAFASPRSWKFVSDAMKINDENPVPQHILHATVAGSVGEGIAITFMEHKRFADALPKTEDVLSGKVKSLTTKSVSAKYTLMMNCAVALRELFQNKTNSKSAEDVKKFKAASENFFSFVINQSAVSNKSNFEPEMIVLSVQTMVNTYGIVFPVNESPELAKALAEVMQFFPAIK